MHLPFRIPGLFCIILFTVYRLSYGDIVKPSEFAGGFYPNSPKQLEAAIHEFIQKVDQSQIIPHKGKTLKALIMPHAGYVYSGQTAAYATFFLDASRFNKVIMLGVDHRTGFTGAVVNCADYWRTPLGNIRIHKDAQKIADRYTFFKPMKKTWLKEHSIEVILPFLQYKLKDFSMVPVTVGIADIKKTAHAIETIIDEKTLVVASADLSHYLPYDAAKKADADTLNMMLKLNYKSLLKKQNSSCGRYPVSVLMRIAQNKGWVPELIHSSNSGDSAGGRNRVVGYATLAFCEEMEKVTGFTHFQGKILLDLARHTISERLGLPINVKKIATLKEQLKETDFHQKRGVFVTLNKHDRLRGCIGTIQAEDSIGIGVMKNAIAAAFKDPRFPDLTRQEFDQIEIEVSILTEPEKIEYTSAKELLTIIRPYVDGLIITKGSLGATFLPQVWDQIPKPEDFLTDLCRKAGLPGDEWKHGTLEVKRYQVQYFEE